MSEPPSGSVRKVKTRFRMKEIAIMKRTAMSGRYKLQFDRLYMIYPFWSAPIMLMPAELTPQAMLRQKYML